MLLVWFPWWDGCCFIFKYYLLTSVWKVIWSSSYIYVKYVLGKFHLNVNLFCGPSNIYMIVFCTKPVNMSNVWKNILCTYCRLKLGDNQHNNIIVCTLGRESYPLPNVKFTLAQYIHRSVRFDTFNHACILLFQHSMVHCSSCSYEVLCFFSNIGGWLVNLHLLSMLCFMNKLWTTFRRAIKDKLLLETISLISRYMCS